MTVMPEIKSIDIQGSDLKSWSPPHHDDFYVRLTLSIGPATSTAAEYFYCSVCSAHRLTKMLDEEGAMFLNKIVVLANFDAARIESLLQKKVRSIQRAEWNEVVQALRCYFDWQFDGYGSPSEERRRQQ